MYTFNSVLQNTHVDNLLKKNNQLGTLDYIIDSVNDKFSKRFAVPEYRHVIFPLRRWMLDNNKCLTRSATIKNVYDVLDEYVQWVGKKAQSKTAVWDEYGFSTTRKTAGKISTAFIAKWKETGEVEESVTQAATAGANKWTGRAVQSLIGSKDSHVSITNWLREQASIVSSKTVVTATGKHWNHVSRPFIDWLIDKNKSLSATKLKMNTYAHEYFNGINDGNIDSYAMKFKTTRAPATPKKNLNVKNKKTTSAPKEYKGKTGNQKAAEATACQESLCCYMMAAVQRNKQKSLEFFTYGELAKYKNNVDTDRSIETIEKFFSEDNSYLYSTYRQAHVLFAAPGITVDNSTVYHRGSTLTDKIIDDCWAAAKEYTGGKMGKDKWNPADIWAIQRSYDGKDVFAAEGVEAKNKVLRDNMNKNIIPISLKKIDSGAGTMTKHNHKDFVKKVYDLLDFILPGNNMNNPSLFSGGRIKLTFSYGKSAESWYMKFQTGKFSGSPGLAMELQGVGARGGSAGGEHSIMAMKKAGIYDKTVLLAFEAKAASIIKDPGGDASKKFFNEIVKPRKNNKYTFEAYKKEFAAPFTGRQATKNSNSKDINDRITRVLMASLMANWIIKSGASKDYATHMIEVGGAIAPFSGPYLKLAN